METIKLDPFTRLLSISFGKPVWLMTYVHAPTFGTQFPDGRFDIRFSSRAGTTIPPAIIAPGGHANNHVITQSDIDQGSFNVSTVVPFVQEPHFASAYLLACQFSKMPHDNAGFGIDATVEINAVNVSYTVIVGMITQETLLGRRVSLTKPAPPFASDTNTIGFNEFRTGVPVFFMFHIDLTPKHENLTITGSIVPP